MTTPWINGRASIVSLTAKLSFSPPRLPKPLVTAPTNPSTTVSQEPVPAAHPVLPTTNVNAITDLEFDVTNLYKLTPLEDITLFDLNLKAATFGGLLIGMDGSVSSIAAMSKLEKTLPSFVHWFSVFSVYALIRTAFDVTGAIGPALSIQRTKDANSFAPMVIVMFVL